MSDTTTTTSTDGTGEQQQTQPPAAYTPPASQADFDRIVEARLARERAKYADYDDLKKKATDHDTYLDSQKGEHEKALDEAKKTTEAETSQRFLSRLVSTEAKAIAATLGFNDPADALAAIKADALPVKDDEPDTDAIKKAVEQLATDKPYLLKADAPKPSRRPKPDEGDKSTTSNDGKSGKAAAALRQLGAHRRSA